MHNHYVLFGNEFKKNTKTFEQLDGDIVRTVFPKTGFSKDERNMHIRRVGFLAGILERNDFICKYLRFISKTNVFIFCTIDSFGSNTC